MKVKGLHIISTHIPHTRFLPNYRGIQFSLVFEFQIGR